MRVRASTMADTRTEPSPQPLSRRERGFYR
jgi:hypothetical protein